MHLRRGSGLTAPSRSRCTAANVRPGPRGGCRCVPGEGSGQAGSRAYGLPGARAFGRHLFPMGRAAASGADSRQLSSDRTCRPGEMVRGTASCSAVRRADRLLAPWGITRPPPRPDFRTGRRATCSLQLASLDTARMPPLGVLPDPLKTWAPRRHAILRKSGAEPALDQASVRHRRNSSQVRGGDSEQGGRT